MANNAAGLEVSTIMMCLLFGTNALLFLMFHFVRANNRRQVAVVEEENKDKKVVKELSKPFVGTLDCFYNLTGELWRTGLIMLLTYVCERHWPFDHSAKHYDRDLFLFVILVFFLYGLYTVKPIHDLALLGREQTEEWKGWMQFIFLLYHYFHAEEVYNSVRVMITCYVWMTGFGNFSFFFVTQDFGWLRVVHMLWRLNFAVLLLMWTHGNTWILYYICPMHTFYFAMVYVTMYVFSSANASKWGIRVKLMVVGLLIYLVWDVNNGLFDKLFAFLGTETVIGAGRGSVWEWYFRTSLDHWSSFLGMIFACNFPLAEQYFVRAQGPPLYVAAVAFAILSVWWYCKFYTLEKLDYNMMHSYTAIIPLTAYIFFRNMTPSIRSYVSMSLHDLGKTTLETYLLQHHIWLSSNAKTLLTIVPGHPWVNFAVCSVLFFYASKELYRLTMSLRGMLLPDNHQQALQSIISMCSALVVLFGLAFVLNAMECGWFHIGLTCAGLFLVTTLVISRFAKKTTDSPVYQFWAGRFSMGSIIAIVALFFLILGSGGSHSSMTSIVPAPTPTGLVVQTTTALPRFQGSNPECQAAIHHGTWEYTPCHEPLPSTVNKAALCETYQWKWDALPMPGYQGKAIDCPIGRVSSSKAKSVFKNKRVVFVGDSEIRYIFVEFVRLLNPKFKAADAINPNTRHGDIPVNIEASNTNVTFVYAPFVMNITKYVNTMPASASSAPNYLVMGAAAWDALHIRNLVNFNAALDGLEKAFSSKSLTTGGLSSTVLMWVQPTYIVDRLLNTPDKQKYMTEAIVSQYRTALQASSLAKLVSSRGLVLNTTLVSLPKTEETTDGVHYSPEVYTVLAQMTANSYALRFPTFYVPTPFGAVKKQTPKVTGAMSYPSYGGYVLLISAIMLVTMDSFFGIGYLSLLIFGKSLDWDVAYAPFLRKINRNREAAEAAAGGAGSGSSSSSSSSGSSPPPNLIASASSSSSSAAAHSPTNRDRESAVPLLGSRDARDSDDVENR
jgi:hypothetical protein